MTDQNQQSLLLGKIAAYTEILVKDSNSTIFVSLAETYRKMGMFDDARQIILKGLTLHPDFSPAYIVLARTLCQLEDYSGSVTAFERALEFDEESLAALVGYARVQILLGEEEAARELLLKARHLTPADPVINKLLLSLPDKSEFKEQEIEEGQSDDDIEGGQESVDQSSPLVSSTLADLYLAQGLSEKALELYQRLSMNHPDDLSLRRRVKELEKQIETDESDILADAGPLPNQSLDVNVSAETEAEDHHTIETSTDDFVAETAIETLERWLANIQRRRGNV